ncbi:MAG: DUF2461 domain-containing protein [Bacteroidota bacterium]
MSKRKIFEFLRDLNDNNSKDWMDANRGRYEEAKQIWIAECGRILDRLEKHDDYFSKIKPKDTIERINNNLLYHPNKPTYKDHFGFSPSSGKGSGIYVSAGTSYSFIGGGVHNPSNEVLKQIRGAIDYDGEELQKAIDSKTFQGFWGGLDEDEDKLKTSPKGYTQDHKHIELLRRKHFTASKRITQQDILSDDFPELIEEAYLKLKPLTDYLAKALDEERL